MGTPTKSRSHFGGGNVTLPFGDGTPGLVRALPSRFRSAERTARCRVISGDCNFGNVAFRLGNYTNAVGSLATMKRGAPIPSIPTS